MRTCLCLSLLLAAACLASQTPAERLGYGPDEKLLIVHADDLGVTHATNTASFAGLRRGSISSASVMANTAWLPEVARFARENPSADLGMHLTLTSEWPDLKWGPVAGAGRVPSLVDSAGYLPDNCAAVAQNADPEEVRTELIAQIERARKLGIIPTHLDTHMGCLMATPAFFTTYLETGRAYNIPTMLPQEDLQRLAPGLLELTTGEDLLIDRLFMAEPADHAGGLSNYYRKVLTELPPGINLLIIHTAVDGAESGAMAAGTVAYGNAWRQDDYDFVTGESFTELLAEQNIRLVTWRELAERRKRR
ncbi:polysaccharide deacetylase family protein [Lewinella sp. IMCC34183]|uniref:polysaccharide deacetylase family protein n=1 Tax=Lewinella sp. IMCC34183 TaxID=2248762 RepID=UPI000E2813C4|nr:polysaccharide deacetylase family protein [Lewinella sp. IMCC34183]